MIRILPYSNKYKDQINSMLIEIDSEFELSISNIEASEKSKPLDNYCVALDQDRIVGTIGLIKIDDESIVLKNMFVRKSHRGSTIGLSASLLQEVLDWCKLAKATHIYLGTMSQFYAAHKFYEKNGFQKIAKNELPLNFNANPIDDVFYKKLLAYLHFNYKQ